MIGGFYPYFVKLRNPYPWHRPVPFLLCAICFHFWVYSVDWFLNRENQWLVLGCGPKVAFSDRFKGNWSFLVEETASLLFGIKSGLITAAVYWFSFAGSSHIWLVANDKHSRNVLQRSRIFGKNCNKQDMYLASNWLRICFVWQTIHEIIWKFSILQNGNWQCTDVFCTRSIIFYKRMWFTYCIDILIIIVMLHDNLEIV